MEVLLIIVAGIAICIFKQWQFDVKRKRRRDYYRNVYLKSDDWKRKRYVVLKRDNWRCVYCGARATQVHHKRYAKRNIGKEPIKWLVSVCKPCHDKQLIKSFKEINSPTINTDLRGNTKGVYVLYLLNNQDKIVTTYKIILQ